MNDMICVYPGEKVKVHKKESKNFKIVEPQNIHLSVGVPDSSEDFFLDFKNYKDGAIGKYFDLTNKCIFDFKKSRPVNSEEIIIQTPKSDEGGRLTVNTQGDNGFVLDFDLKNILKKNDTNTVKMCIEAETFKDVNQKIKSKIDLGEDEGQFRMIVKCKEKISSQEENKEIDTKKLNKEEKRSIIWNFIPTGYSIAKDGIERWMTKNFGDFWENYKLYYGKRNGEFYIAIDNKQFANKYLKIFKNYLPNNILKYIKVGGAKVKSFAGKHWVTFLVIGSLEIFAYIKDEDKDFKDFIKGLGLELVKGVVGIAITALLTALSVAALVALGITASGFIIGASIAVGATLASVAITDALFSTEFKNSFLEDHNNMVDDVFYHGGG
nr:hypothetical protein 2 [Candidatus Aminicenantes bacterium]